MVKFVTKKSGEKVPLDENKTKGSIMAAAREAGHDEGKASALANEVAGSVLRSRRECRRLLPRGLHGDRGRRQSTHAALPVHVRSSGRAGVPPRARATVMTCGAIYAKLAA